MKIFASEQDLLSTLDHFDAIVRSCATGSASWSDFERAYGVFYGDFALDGHESDQEERDLLAKHSARIVVHEKIHCEILCCLTDERFAADPNCAAIGLLGPAQAHTRLRELASHHGLVDD